MKTTKNKMIPKNKTIIIVIYLTVLLLSNATALTTNGTQKTFDFTITSGKNAKILSGNFTSYLVVGGISSDGTLDSSNYKAELGFLKTTGLITGDSCQVNLSCVNSVCCDGICTSSCGEEAPVSAGGGPSEVNRFNSPIPKQIGVSEYVHFFTSIKAFEEIVLNINKKDFAVVKIMFVLNEDLEDITFSIKLVKFPEYSINSAYQYFEIKSDKINDLNLISSIIYFKIKKESNIIKETITLNKYNNKWNELPTNFIEEDSEYYYYDGDTQGFSLFAITGEKKVLISKKPLEEIPEDQLEFIEQILTPIEEIGIGGFFEEPKEIKILEIKQIPNIIFIGIIFTLLTLALLFYEISFLHKIKSRFSGFKYKLKSIFKTSKILNKHKKQLIKKRKAKTKYKIFLLIIFLTFLTILFISSILVESPSITAYSIIAKEYIFTDDIGITLKESTNYTWNQEHKGALKSISLNGELQNQGKIKIYLENDNETYIIFDSTKLEEKGLGKITGSIIYEDDIEFIREENLTIKQTTNEDLIEDIEKTKNDVEVQELEIPEEIIDDTVLNETLINNTINITPIINDSIFINNTINETNVTIPLNETITPIINETINITPIINDTINITPIINKIIEMNLEYKGNSIYDNDNNGIENIDNAIDLTVENTKFNLPIKEENLCTRWNVYSVDEEKNTLVCYGSNKCCNFVDFLSIREDWNEPFYSSYGQFGATLNNIISAQVLYVDYNLSLDDPYSEIYYSEWKNLTTKFYQGYSRFENVCLETCILPDLIAPNYKFIIEIINSSLILDSINYVILGDETVNYPPILLNNFTNISFLKGKTYSINLSEYFYDLENDTLIFNNYNNSKINVEITNETAILKSNDFIGTTYMFFTANDSLHTTTSNVFRVEIKEKKILGILKSLRQMIGLS